MYRYRTQRGFTIIELMIVVAIVVILGTLSMVIFTKYKKRGIKAEAYANLAKIGVAEEMFRSEYGSYFGCATQKPTVLHTTAEPIRKDNGLLYPACWLDLGFKPDRWLWCGYTMSAGAAGSYVQIAHVGPFAGKDDDPGGSTTLGAGAQTALGATPTAAWYVGQAECNLDGSTDTTRSSFFYKTSLSTTVIETGPYK